jgi:hypothetical protein
MTPDTDDALSAVSLLVARCPTFEAASHTVEYLCSRGVPREALSVVADVARPSGPGDGGRWLRWDAWKTARRRVPQRSRRHYVISDQRSARRARRLLATDADAQGETFGVRAVPCVGQLSSKSQHPSHGVVRVRWWSRWARRQLEKT